jgi:hypothetical protein
LRPQAWRTRFNRGFERLSFGYGGLTRRLVTANGYHLITKLIGELNCEVT